MHLHQAPRDGQPQAGADALSSGLAGLEIFAENGLVIRRRDARTRIGDADRYAAVARVDPHRDAALAGELDRIADDVTDHLAHAARIGEGERRLTEQL